VWYEYFTTTVVRVTEEVSAVEAVVVVVMVCIGNVEMDR
jgi:hypothetical protein